MIDIKFAAAKANKYASRESGDTVEVVERPTAPGGMSIILADGQGSGRNAKTLSNIVTSRCVALLKDGVRDGAVARAVNDHLFAYRHGQVSATLNIISADFLSRTLVITRNNPEPVFIIRSRGEEEEVKIEITGLTEEAVPIGIYPRTRPVITELDLEAGLAIIAFSDGISGAGSRYDEKIELEAALRQIFLNPVVGLDANNIAGKILDLALAHDRFRPQDDMSVIVVTTSKITIEDGTPVPRRLSTQITFQ